MRARKSSAAFNPTTPELFSLEPRTSPLGPEAAKLAEAHPGLKPPWGSHRGSKKRGL
jgi:hypothetical protein